MPRASACAPCRSSTSPAGTSPRRLARPLDRRRCSAAATGRCPRPRSSATRRARWAPRRPAPRPRELYAAGWRRFKAPTGGAAERSAARLRAARAAAPDAWLGHGRGLGLRRRRRRRRRSSNSIPDVGLGWFEDVFPPGDAGMLRALRDRIDVPIAQGDEQGGSYYPEALIARRRRRRRPGRPHVHGRHHRAVGGSSTRSLEAGLAFAPHMFPHVHSQVLAALGLRRRPDRVGHPVHRRPPHGRPAAAAGDHRRRPDGAAPRGPGLRPPGGRRLGPQPAPRRPGRDPRRPLRPSRRRDVPGAQRGWWLEDAVPGADLAPSRTAGRSTTREHVWLAWVTDNVSDVHGNADRALAGRLGPAARPRGADRGDRHRPRRARAADARDVDTRLASPAGDRDPPGPPGRGRRYPARRVHDRRSGRLRRTR